MPAATGLALAAPTGGGGSDDEDNFGFDASNGYGAPPGLGDVGEEGADVLSDDDGGGALGAASGQSYGG